MDFSSILGGMGGGGGGGGYADYARTATGIAGGATGALGSIIGAFGKKKTVQKYYNKPLAKLTGESVDWLKSDNPLYESSLKDYGAANTARIANTKRLAGMAETDFGDLLSGQKSYNPYAGISQALNPQVAALKDVMGYAGDQGRRENSLALAALGRGGRPSSGSYEQALIADRTARQFAPQFGNIVSNLPGLYGTAEGSRLNNLNASMGLIDRRTGTADYGAGLELNPAMARQAIRGGQFNQMGQLGDISRQNTAGFQEKGNIVSRIGEGLQDAGGYMMQGAAAGGGTGQGAGPYGGQRAGGGGGNQGFFGGGGGNMYSANYPITPNMFGGSGAFGGPSSVPSNWWSLSPAERANASSYAAMVQQGVPAGSVWE